MTEIERLEKVRFFLKKNKGEFAAILGYKNPQNYTSFLSGKTRLTLNMMKALKTHCNQINTNWLLWEEGPMLLPQTSITDSKTITGNHTQATVTGNISNTKNTTSSNIEHIELLKERIKDKEANIKTLQELLESNKNTISLYKERVAALKEEVQKLKNQ